jgi:cytochrome c-type biogenesis protein CcmH/NrfG
MFSPSKTLRRTSRASAHQSRLLLIATSLTATALIASVSAWTWLNPTRAGARHNANGDRYLSKEKPAEAIIEYRAALKNLPNSAPTFRKLGDAYRKIGEFARAGDAFRYAADLTADDLRAQLVAGWYSLVQHRPEDAARYAQRVLDVDPNNASAARLLASAMACFGEFAAGLDILRAAAEHEPLNAATFGDIGLLEAARGDADAANEADERARQLTPPGFGGLGGGWRINPAVTTPPPFQGVADPAIADPLPGESDPVVVIETTGVDGGGGGTPPSTIITGALKTSPDGSTTVQFSALDGESGRPVGGLAAAQGFTDAAPDVTAVPEPASLLLLLGGGMTGGGSRWLKRRRAARAR